MERRPGDMFACQMFVSTLANVVQAGWDVAAQYFGTVAGVMKRGPSKEVRHGCRPAHAIVGTTDACLLLFGFILWDFCDVLSPSAWKFWVSDALEDVYLALRVKSCVRCASFGLPAGSAGCP
jgi:hypothetical protein